MGAQLTWSPDSPWLSIQFLQGQKQFLKKENLSAEEGADAPESEGCMCRDSGTGNYQRPCTTALLAEDTWSDLGTAEGQSSP